MQTITLKIEDSISEKFWKFLNSFSKIDNSFLLSNLKNAVNEVNKAILRNEENEDLATFLDRVDSEN